MVACFSYYCLKDRQMDCRLITIVVPDTKYQDGAIDRIRIHFSSVDENGYQQGPRKNNSINDGFYMKGFIQIINKCQFFRLESYNGDKTKILLNFLVVITHTEM